MANLIRRRGSSPLSRAWRATDVDPFSSWDEWLSPRSPRRDVNRLFDDFFSSGALGGLDPTSNFVPSLEVSETDKDYMVNAELPGLTENDVQVEVDDDNRLTIRGEKKSETSESRGGYDYSERSYGEFVRTVQLPRGTDASKIEASFENGVLQLHIPKTEKARARPVPIGKGQAEPKKMEQATAAAGPAQRSEGATAPRAQQEKQPPQQEASRH